MKIQDLLNFEKFFMNVAEVSFPLRVSYKLNKIYKAILPDLEFYRSELKKSVDECGKFDAAGNLMYSEDGTNILLKDGKAEEFGARFKELIEMEVSYDNSLNLSIDELPDTNMTPVELMQIQKFID